MAPKWSRHVAYAPARSSASRADEEEGGETQQQKCEFHDIIFGHNINEANKREWEQYLNFAFATALRVAEQSDRLPDQRGIPMEKIQQLQSVHTVAAFKALGSNCPLGPMPV